MSAFSWYIKYITAYHFLGNFKYLMVLDVRLFQGWSTFYVMRSNFGNTGLHAGNVKVNMENKDWVMYLIYTTCLLFHTSCGKKYTTTTGGCIGSSWGNRREGDLWGDLGVDGWILGWICRRWDVGIWTGLGWPRIETGGGRLWVR